MPATSTSPAAGQVEVRTDASVISYLAYLGILLAVGIDISLPAFDELDAAFGLSDRGVSVGVVGTVYILGMAIGQLVFGVASDRFGRRSTMLFGIGLYSVGVLTAIFATSLEVLLAGRLLWGLGAAAPFVLRQAIARDLYDGDRMARIITIVTAVFLLGPIFVPIVGAGILLFAPWQGVFAAALIASAAAWVWTLRFGETLAVDERRPLQVRPLLDALRLVVTTRVTIGHIGAQTFASAAFFIWLGSAQPIIDDIYDRGSQFAFWFAASGVVIALALLANGRMIGRFGARRVAVAVSSAFVVVGVVGVAVTFAASGVPSIWAFFAWAAITNALGTLVTPLCTSLALEPMGALAGTASAVLGALSLGGGALLAAVVDARIDATVTPMVVGSLLFGTTGLALLLWAGAPSRSTPRRRRPRSSTRSPVTTSPTR
jgi:DHA1 family bicyclomycin/chloramphenicol resistance-like MFS transporter